MKQEKLDVKNITFEIINACNLRCKFCSIWQEKEDRYLPPHAVTSLLASKIFPHPLESITLTGGEPFLHPQFDELFKSLIALKLKKCLRKIGISSNGYDTDRIKAFLKKNKSYLKDLGIFISLDGLQKTHNILRGRKDAFERTINTIKSIKTEYEEIELCVKFTISEVNVKEIIPVYNFCKQNNLKILFKIAENSNLAYYHRNDKSVNSFSLSRRLRLSIAEKLSAVLVGEKMQKAKIINSSYVEALINYLKKDLHITSCLTPSYYLFVDSAGNAYPCLYQKPITNILQQNWQEEFYKKGYTEIIERAEKGLCPGCMAYHGYLKYWNFKNAEQK